MHETTRRVFIWGAATLTASGLLLGVQRICSSAFADSENGPDVGGPVKIARFAADGTPAGIVSVSKVRKNLDAWRKQLTPLQFEVTRRADTESAFSGALDKEFSPGLYRCIDCDNALFNSHTKFDSGTGWPSFWAPIAKENVAEETDRCLGMERTEVLCRKCDAHLGHVFPDGPQPTGLRYCMNSASLLFVKREPPK